MIWRPVVLQLSYTAAESVLQPQSVPYPALLCLDIVDALVPGHGQCTVSDGGCRFTHHPCKALHLHALLSIAKVDCRCHGINGMPFNR